ALQQEMEDGKVHPKAVKQQLARELTVRFHGREAAIKAEENFERVFKKHDLPDDIPEKVVSTEESEIWLPRLLVDTGMVKGTGEARRMIKQNAVSVDGEKITDVDYNVKASGEVLLKVGKRRFCKVKF
ncbi:MAG: tyrosine--tRNA ligase, partial [Desulfobulbaceae bacterium]|nr:tyrosine--tRNA ligase [Desulfobulbaceae bacterium]